MSEKDVVRDNKMILFEQEKEKIKNHKPIKAICYDFDKTLSPDDMQTYTVIPSFNMNKEDFWGECDVLAKENKMDNNLCWMYKILLNQRIKESI